jgi:ABC-type uncharacterized transport system YnjBCD substrate-binding protein
MDQPVLSDKTQFPTEEIIYSHLGKAKNIWISFFEYLHENHPDITPEWRYYNDGKSWLMKVTRKKKTVFWLSIQKGTFRVTFYFTDRAADAIAGSTIPEEMKKQFKEGKRFNKIRGLTVLFKYKKDIKSAKTLLSIKLNTK